jgi:hypothetical protein
VNGERILGYLEVLSGGGFRPPRATLVITDRRLVIAQRTRAVEDLAKASAGGSGGGFGRLFGRRPAAPPFGERYVAMTPEAILAETAGNGVFTAADVRLIEVIAGQSPNDDAPPTPFVLVHVVSHQGDWQFMSTGQAPAASVIREALRPAFGPLLLG